MNRNKLSKILRKHLLRETSGHIAIVQDMIEYIEDLLRRDPDREYDRAGVYEELYNVFHADPDKIEEAMSYYF